MANLNRVHLIGRLTRDPEARSFSQGKVVSFGFAVNNRKKVNGEWTEEPCFLDVKCFDRENGRKLASLVEQYLKKGSQAYLEGKLVMETWEDRNGGGKRSKLAVVAEDVQFLGAKQERAAPPAPETETNWRDQLENSPF